MTVTDIPCTATFSPTFARAGLDAAVAAGAVAAVFVADAVAAVVGAAVEAADCAATVVGFDATEVDAVPGVTVALLLPLPPVTLLMITIRINTPTPSIIHLKKPRRFFGGVCGVGC